MRSLLEETGKMLKSMPGAWDSGAPVDDERHESRNLQRQLDELKGGTMKVLRLARVQGPARRKGPVGFWSHSLPSAPSPPGRISPSMQR